MEKLGRFNAVAPRRGISRWGPSPKYEHTKNIKEQHV